MTAFDPLVRLPNALEDITVTVLKVTDDLGQESSGALTLVRRT